MVKWLDDISPSVLDVGCGLHKTLSWLVGVDPRPQVTDMVGDAEELPVRARSTQAIVMRHSLEHVLDQTKAVKEWLRVLVPGGRVIIVLPDHGRIDTMDPRLSSGEHLHAYSRESFVSFISLFPELAIRTGGTVIEDWSFGFVLEKNL